MKTRFKLNWNWLTVLIVGAGVTTLIAVILRVLTPTIQPLPQTPLTVTNIDNSTSEISGVVYEGSEFKPPTSLELFNVTTTGDRQTLIDNLTKKYSLQPIPEFATVWQGSEYSLFEYPEIFQFKLLLNDPQSGASQITQEQAVAAARAFIIPIYGEGKLQPVISDVETNQNIFQVPLSYMLNNLPVVYGNTDQVITKVTVGFNQEVTGASFFPLFATFAPAQSMPTISVSEAIANINSGKGSVVAAFQEELESFSLAQIRSGRMNKVTLQYKVDSTLNLAYPFYQFSGTIVTADGVEVDASLSTPAVATTTP